MDSVDISKEDWIALIDDPEVFNGKSLEVLGYFYEEEDHQASTKQITDKYGLASKNFNGVIIGLGKRAQKVLGQRATVVQQSNPSGLSYWCLFFHGHEDNGFVWRVREPLGEALHETGILSVFREENEKEDPLCTEIFKEGQITKIYGRKYERNPQIRRAFVKNFKKKHGRVYCEACGFDFGKTYGKLGEGFIEVHHNKPISSFKDEHEVDIEKDLNCLCSNCHRMIHANKKRILSVEELRAKSKRPKRTKPSFTSVDSYLFLIIKNPPHAGRVKEGRGT